MARFAYMEENLKCPFCDAIIQDLIWFQWGYCPASQPLPESTYHIGDSINWKSCKDGSVPAWTYFVGYELIDDAAQFGDVKIKNVIVKDLYNYPLDWYCPKCHKLLGGAAIEIVNNIVTRAWVCKPDELNDAFQITVEDTVISDRVGYYLLLEDDILPQPDWNEHDTTFLTHDCEIIEDLGKWRAQNYKPNS